MHVDDILAAMRDGQVQSAEAIEAFVRGLVDGSVSRPQAAAWLAWAYTRGLTDAETVVLTRAMTTSSAVLTWPPGPALVDKHSTGGVGDKVSLVLAPLWAELGLRVPMISGRGLAQTGGTLDKLESIPGYRCDLDVASLQRQLDDVGCFIAGQTGDLAAADRILYALRNETSTVPSIPLIVGSILSKKIAAGVERLVLDVKVGSGAFMKDAASARRLAGMLVSVGSAAGLDCSARITEMGRPLGATVGNALEVREAIGCLRGEGPDDLRDLTLELADHPSAAEVLSSGRALQRFARMVEAQGGDPRVVDAPERLLGAGTSEVVFRAPRTGHLVRIDALAVGRAAFLLGAGRQRADDPVDPGVGLVLRARLGDRVHEGDVIATVHHRRERGLAEALDRLHKGIEVDDGPCIPGPLVIERVGTAPPHST